MHITNKMLVSRICKAFLIISEKDTDISTANGQNIGMALQDSKAWAAT